MALITCPECGREVSSRAAACPQCAAPIASPEVQTIEATGKREKTIQLVGIGGMILSSPVLFATLAAGEHAHTLVAATVLVLSGVVYTYGRFTAWWNHG